MGLITTSTPAGINPFTGDPNWQKLASGLIKAGNGIGLDNDGALINLGATSSGSGTVYTADNVWIHLDTASSTFSHIGPSTITASNQYFYTVQWGDAASASELILGRQYLKFDGKGHYGGTASGLTATLFLYGDLWVNFTHSSTSTLVATHASPAAHNSGTYDINSTLFLAALNSTSSNPSLTAIYRDNLFDDKGHSTGSVNNGGTLTLRTLVSTPTGTSNTYLLTLFNSTQSWLAIPNDGKKYVPYTLNGTWGYLQLGSC